jgi:fibronectin type 3 domain-containing protein
MRIRAEHRLGLMMAVVFCFAASGVVAQFGQRGEVFVANDYRQKTPPAIIVKWFARKVYYKDGFNVYRKAEGETNWTKLNAQPLKVKAVVPPAIAQRDKDLKALLDAVNKTPYDEFQKGVPKVFVLMKAIMSPDFAELLGTIYYDETAEAEKSYQYEVRGLMASAEETINTSRAITRGAHQKELPPQEIQLTRKPNGIEINWKPEELRYYGVHVYRRLSGASEWTKINRQPRNIYKSADKNGNQTYPDVFYFDDKVSRDTAYQYQLTVVDYFGQESEFSEVISVSVIDFNPPLPPLDLQTSLNVLDVTLSWTIQPTEDLAGFKVYRSENADSAMTVMHSGTLPKDQNKFPDHLLKTGGYYYRVAAIDVNGNEGLSQKIFIEVRDVTPPLPPRNVFVKTDTGKVILTWNSNSEPDLKGYYVYRSLHDGNHHDNEFIVVNTVAISENTYTEVLPKNVRNKFVYAVVAEDQSFNRSKMSAISVVGLPDVKAPSRPVIRNVRSDSDKLIVEWLPSPETDLAGYNIFRSTDSVNFKQMNLNAYASTSYRYTDNQVVANQRYFYYVQAADSAGNVSIPSNIFTGTNTAPVKGNSPQKVQLEYVKSRKEVKLSWSLPSSSQITGAVVFRSQDKINFRPVTGLLKENSFTDKEIKKGTTYYYQVKSYTNTGVVEPSDIFQTTVTE